MLLAKPTPISMTNVGNQLRDTAAGVGHAAPEIDGIQTTVSVTIGQQPEPQMNQDMIKRRQDRERECVYLPHLFPVGVSTGIPRSIIIMQV